MGCLRTSFGGGAPSATPFITQVCYTFIHFPPLAIIYIYSIWLIQKRIIIAELKAEFSGIASNIELVKFLVLVGVLALDG